MLLVAAACGRFGFDAQRAASDSAISDGNGSGSAAPFVPWGHSGPRIRARVLDGGGDPIFYGWHDSALATDCQPALASDGVERCMPFRDLAGTIFSDAGCTQPLAVVYHGTCGSDAYAYDDSSGMVVEYPIGGIYAGTVYANPGACAPTSLPPNAAAPARQSICRTASATTPRTSATSSRRRCSRSSPKPSSKCTVRA